MYLYKALDEHRKPTGIMASPIALNVEGFVLISEAEFGTLALKFGDPRPNPPGPDDKLAALSTACNAAIVSGCDIQLEGGVEHFEYALEDQSNISEMFNAIVLGATEYPYQSTDGSCRIYQAADIVTIYTTLAAHKTTTLAYYHALKDYVRDLEDPADIQSTTWGQPLEGSYLDAYNAAIESAQRQMQIILTRIGGGTDA